MLSTRKESILKSIVGQYIANAIPVPSQSIIKDCELAVSAATIRNEMAYLEHEGYITRPHPSAGGIPLDKGYRYYVASIGDVTLPIAEQRLISHLFHQIERELGEWLNLAAALIAQMVQNTVVITTPRPEACQFKHLELVSLQEFMVLVVLVLGGAKVRQQLITFDQTISQPELTAIADKLRSDYSGLTSSEILAKTTKLPPTRQKVTDCVVRIMEAEDDREHEEERYLDGLYFMINQPEFANGQRLLSLMELIEQRNLLRSIIPPELTSQGVQVIIGRENKKEVIHDCSVVISQYGLPNEAAGTISVIGPTRMPYARTMATVSYLSSVLSMLVARLFGKEIMEIHAESNLNTYN